MASLSCSFSSSNTANTHVDQNACPDASGFTGHLIESEGNLGLYHAQARNTCPPTGGYDPEVPRFYGVDAMRGDMPGWNQYYYTFNNPVRFVDPDGNMPRAIIEFLGIARDVGLAFSLNANGIAGYASSSASLSVTLTTEQFSIDGTTGLGVGVSPIMVDGNVSGAIGLATESSSDSQVTATAWAGPLYGSVSTSSEAVGLLLSPEGSGVVQDSVKYSMTQALRVVWDLAEQE
jgi:RHS repeat-associated protein